MVKRDIFDIIAKSFGLYCMVQLIRSTPAVIGAISVDRPEFIINKSLYIFTLSLYPLVFLFLAVIFLFKSEIIVKLLFPESKSVNAEEDQIVNGSPVYAKLSFWIVIIGLYYLISATASVLAGLPTIFIKLKEGWFLIHDPFLPQTLILILSLICIFKSEKIEKIIYKLKDKKT